MNDYSSHFVLDTNRIPPGQRSIAALDLLVDGGLVTSDQRATVASASELQVERRNSGCTHVLAWMLMNGVIDEQSLHSVLAKRLETQRIAELSEHLHFASAAIEMAALGRQGIGWEALALLARAGVIDEGDQGHLELDLPWGGSVPAQPLATLIWGVKMESIDGDDVEEWIQTAVLDDAEKAEWIAALEEGRSASEVDMRVQDNHGYLTYLYLAGLITARQRDAAPHRPGFRECELLSTHMPFWLLCQGLADPAVLQKQAQAETLANEDDDIGRALRWYELAEQGRITQDAVELAFGEADVGSASYETVYCGRVKGTTQEPNVVETLEWLRSNALVSDEEYEDLQAEHVPSDDAPSHQEFEAHQTSHVPARMAAAAPHAIPGSTEQLSGHSPGATSGSASWSTWLVLLLLAAVALYGIWRYFM